MNKLHGTVRFSLKACRPIIVTVLLLFITPTASITYTQKAHFKHTHTHKKNLKNIKHTRHETGQKVQLIYNLNLNLTVLTTKILLKCNRGGEGEFFPYKKIC